jgi:hypothetical protein
LNTPFVVWIGFILLPVAVAAAVILAARSWALTLTILTWMALAAALAKSGILSRFDLVPPPIGLLLGVGFIGTIAVGRSFWVKNLIELPWHLVIGFHAFRILVEILIHKASTIGLAPPQMSWSGYNLDIVTGLSAFCFAPFARSAPKWLILYWNYLGLTLLAVIVAVATVSFPMRFQLMQPSNTWVATFPYVWLPSVLVTAALLGHVVIFRKLRSPRWQEGVVRAPIPGFDWPPIRH